MDKDNVAKYAGTSKRHSQRILCSEAVVRGWDVATADISWAFLQGGTYEELAEQTGEPLREVNFILTLYCIPFLRKVPGFEDFNPTHEVLHCDKPGTGCNDAPRCFSLKLSKVTRDLCGMQQCSMDNELCFLHAYPSGGSRMAKADGRDAVLQAMMTKHVDDLKTTGPRETALKIFGAIEKVFGPLKINWNNFTNCGIRHAQNIETKEITLDQTEYIQQIKPIIHADLRNKLPDEVCVHELHMLYWSVLGALNFALLTRCDIAVFIGALQRVAQKPTILHCKRLNAVLRWAQRNPAQLKYRRLGSNANPHLRIYSDAAFKKEEADGHSMRGALYIRCTSANADKTKAYGEYTTTAKGHLIDMKSGGQRRVVRSTFVAEALAACDALDQGIVLAQTLHEMYTGNTSAYGSRHLRENGGYKIPMVLYIDALSVFAAATAVFIKIPADQSVLCHLHYLREMLEYDVLRLLVWVDTRDMLADGLTKGSIDRTVLRDAMDGTVMLTHECKAWRPTHFQHHAL